MGKTFAISDIHGCAKTFIALVEDVIQLNKQDHLFLLGDYIDRGPDSRGVIDYIMQLKETGFQVTALKGNHEEMFLRGFTDNNYLRMFVLNGGESTLKSFGVNEIEGINKKYFDFLQSLEYYALHDKYILVHAGINFEIPDPFKDTEFMLWTRRFTVSQKFSDKIVVHGHTPISIVQIQENILNVKTDKKINIDNGCVFGLDEFYGNLCCLELENLKLHIQPNIDKRPMF